MNRQMLALRLLDSRPGSQIPRSPTLSELEVPAPAELALWTEARRQASQEARCSLRSVREAMPIRPTNPLRGQAEPELLIFASAPAAVQPQQSKLPPPEPAVLATSLRCRRLLPRQLARRPMD